MLKEYKAYFDDSGEERDSQHSICAMFGYVAEGSNWPTFERAWQEALDEFDVPYMHMKDFAHFVPPFERFRDNEKDRVAFLQKLAGAIQIGRLKSIGSIIRLADLRIFNQKYGVDVQDYSLNLYTCLGDIADKFDDNMIEVILDRASNRKMGKVIDLARKYVNTDPAWRGCDDNMSVQALPKTIGYKNVLPIQAADFLAYESRKDLTVKESWLASYSGPKHTKEALDSLKSWSTEHGLPFPYIRKSMSMLTRIVPIAAILWDNDYLCRLHVARNQQWPKAE